MTGSTLGDGTGTSNFIFLFGTIEDPSRLDSSALKADALEDSKTSSKKGTDMK
jgi:hypothetical protein